MDNHRTRGGKGRAKLFPVWFPVRGSRFDFMRQVVPKY